MVVVNIERHIIRLCQQITRLQLQRQLPRTHGQHPVTQLHTLRCRLAQTRHHNLITHRRKTQTQRRGLHSQIYGNKKQQHGQRQAGGENAGGWAVVIHSRALHGPWLLWGV